MGDGQRLGEAMASRDPAALGFIRLVPCPVWHCAAKIEELFGLKLRHLKKLAADGRIRRRKLGNSIQADSVYSVTDVLEFMESNEPFACDSDDFAQTIIPEG